MTHFTPFSIFSNVDLTTGYNGTVFFLRFVAVVVRFVPGVQRTVPQIGQRSDVHGTRHRAPFFARFTLHPFYFFRCIVRRRR